MRPSTNDTGPLRRALETSDARGKRLRQELMDRIYDASHGGFASLAMNTLRELRDHIDAEAATKASMLAALKAVDLARHTDEAQDWKRATELADAAIRLAEGRP